MPKHEKWSIKWIGAKMKSKGLQKLRWYCQMCQKQCRDENGFKCHRTSDQHQQMMSVFCQNPRSFMDEFSHTFEKGYMLLMSTTYCQTRVLANDVYKEYIKDRDHLHMNSTIWVTLSGFVQYLGRTGRCKIEKTQKGWWLEYIDNTPEAKKREDDRRAREMGEVMDVDREKKYLDRMIREGIAAGGFQESEFTELQRTDDAPVNLKLNFSAKPVVVSKGNVFEEVDRATSSANMLKRNADESIKEESGARRQKLGTKVQDNWVRPGIIVKVMHKTLGDGAFYKKKGEILKILNTYGADVKMVESGKTLRLDQNDLETVIPARGKPVTIVLGKYRGKDGIVDDIIVDEFKVLVGVQGAIVELRYEEICKLA